MAALVFVAADAGFEFVLGAFAAGLVVGLALDSPEGRSVRMRLEGIGFGFVVPIYFVVTGMNFDLDSLLTASGLALAGLFLALLLVVRGTSALLWFRDLPRRHVLSLALFGATGLPLIVAIVGIATERGAISAGGRRVAHRGGDDLRAPLPAPRNAHRRSDGGHRPARVALDRRHRRVLARHVHPGDRSRSIDGVGARCRRMPA